ncbi:MAG: mechanosensitive ion channel family protein [Bdellovibrionota bacterium]
MEDKFIQTQALYPIIDIEPYLILGSLVLSAWLFYKVFLRDVSDERHRSLRQHHAILLRHFLILSFSFLSFTLMYQEKVSIGAFSRLIPYVALIAFVWGGIVFVRACRLLVLQYLFLTSMKAGVPLLLVNIFTLLVSVVLIFWGVSKAFGFQLAPLLATSAAFSIILGLALQDTLGNLFAGIALQLDKSFEIGDWVEIGVSGTQKVTGQVTEISWRSTLLVGFSDELITLPNKIMSQSQISNFSPEHTPIVRSQLFRFEYGVDIDKAKDILEKSACEISDVRGIPAPFSYVAETTENWIGMKIVYFIDSFGSQFMVGDKVLKKGIEALSRNGIKMAKNRLEIHSGDVRNAVNDGRITDNQST